MLFLVLLVVCRVEAAYEGELCDAHGETGICTNLKDCPSAIDNIKNRTAPRPETCSFVDYGVIVCCARNSKVTENKRRCEPISPEKTSKPSGQRAWDKCIEYQEKYIFPCEKGYSDEFGRVDHCHHTAPELIAGFRVRELEFPHMALMGFQNSEGKIVWRCGGVLISEKFVLTAGHCITNRHSDPLSHAMIGATRSSDQSPANTYRVKKTNIHEKYKSPFLYHDIVLVELDREVPLDHRTVPACLHTGVPIHGNRSVSTGWGYTETSNISMALHKTVEVKFSQSEYAAQYPPHLLMPRGIDEATQICYQSEVILDSCQVDSGGPLQVENTVIACTYTVIGVTSFGKSCGREPRIYTRVEHYLPWIEKIVWP